MELGRRRREGWSGGGAGRDRDAVPGVRAPAPRVAFGSGWQLEAAARALAAWGLRGLRDLHGRLAPGTHPARARSLI